MALDDDLSALLPDPPPPRPGRREAAIAEAMRRFDGEEPAPARQAARRPQPRFSGWPRPQLAALASLALVVLISVPVWWQQRDRIAEVMPPVPPAARSSSDVAAGTEPGAAPQPATADASPAPVASALARAGGAPAPADPAEPFAEVAKPSPQPQAPASARPAAPAARAEESIVVTGSRIARPEFDSNSPMVSVDEEFLEQSSTRAVEQQLNRLPQFAVSPSSTASHGCTILDPSRDLEACRAFADPAARGAAGRAAAQLADGLTFAWAGDLDRAIDAFGRAISADRDLAIAYLNRGLAYHEKGDQRRALADLDRAVARDPDSARGYYHRSLLRRAAGDDARADADARRAIELDPSYRTLLP